MTAMFALTGAMRRAVGDAFDRIGANVLILPGAGRRFARFLLRVLAPASPTVRWHPRLGLLAWLVTVTVALISAYLPARRSSRIDPAPALRFL